MAPERHRRVALVTGANRGIGLEVVRQLAAQDIVTVLSARDLDKAAAAARQLSAEGLPVIAEQLDVGDQDSVDRLLDKVAAEIGRLDIVVNNAGVVLDIGPTSAAPDLGLVQATLDTNLFGAWRVAAAALPLMKGKGYGRIVNVSSAVGAFDRLQGSVPGYRVSKTALNALTRMLAVELSADFPDIMVDAVHPGDVATDLGGADAPRTVAQGADTVVWLATRPGPAPSGGFYYDREAIAW
jgi:NAD(P)-dependent dehydrogenase (short-subunit alcohol dehydrogenase family)